MLSAPPPEDVRLVRTDIAGLAGFAERGPLVDTSAEAAGQPEILVKAAVKLTSWKDFRLIFGGFLPDAFLAYAVRGFFANGGTTCYAVRVASGQTPPVEASLPLPAAHAAQLITFLAGPVKRGQKQIKLDSSGVVSVGDPIIVGPPVSPETFSVVGIIDDRTISVSPVPESERKGGEPVYRIAGSALSQGVMAGANQLPVVNPGAFAKGDLVTVEGQGLSELALVSDTPTASSITVGRALTTAHVAGTVVRKYGAAFTIRACSPGAWGNRIKLEFAPLQPGISVLEFSLRVTVDASKDLAQPAEQEFYPRLSLDARSRKNATPTFAPDVLKASRLIKIEGVSDGENPPIPLLFGQGPLHGGDLHLEGGSDGLARNEVTTEDFTNALNVLELVDDISMLVVPDAMTVPGSATRGSDPPKPGPCETAVRVAKATPAAAISGKWSALAIQQEMLDQCLRRRYRVAILDTPRALQPLAAFKWLEAQPFDRDASRFAAVYYPWLKVPDQLNSRAGTRIVPPCGHVAGCYAYTDSTSGVQKPPANVELDFASDVEQELSNEQQGFLNERGINAIRVFPGRGIRIWGARSISQEAEWHFIHTRRLLSMIEDSVEKASQWTVFRPHDDDLRRTLTHSLNVFLESIWRSGGLKGARAEDSYFVKCDSTNNPQSSIDAGLLICQVGVAIAAPMEFIVFEMRRSVEGPQVTEA